MTDVGTTPRRAMSATRQLRIFEAHNGVCHLCRARIAAGDGWDVEHVRALGLGGKDTDDNCAPVHRRCHSAKTRDDVSRISKAKRQKASALGIKKPSSRPMPGSRASGIKKHMDGTVTRRANSGDDDQGRIILSQSRTKASTFGLWRAGNGDTE